jgi:lincosamide nucleotidyltransferase A/C/D/E
MASYTALPLMSRRQHVATSHLNQRQRAAQLQVIQSVADELRTAGVGAWLFGGWGLDARLGRITREHSDVEFWVDRCDADRSKAVLVIAGATVLEAQPPEESSEFEWDGISFSTAYFDRQADGRFTTKGRWSDWVFPAGSFDDDQGLLDGVPVATMSAGGMLAMKEQYPGLRNGGPWRPKDILDMDALRSLLAAK